MITPIQTQLDQTNGLQPSQTQPAQTSQMAQGTINPNAMSGMNTIQGVYGNQMTNSPYRTMSAIGQDPSTTQPPLANQSPMTNNQTVPLTFQ